MTVKYKDNTGLGTFVDELVNASAQAVRDEMPKIKREIVKQTKSGKQYDGKAFAPYNSAYRARRARLGKSTTPNLKFTGKMLESLKTSVKTSRGEVTGKVFFGNNKAQKKAYYNQGGSKRIPPRIFMGLTDKRIDEVIKTIFKRLNIN